MSVSMVQPEEMLITWDSGFGNAALGTTEDVLGTDGTISRGQQIRYAPQKVNRPDGTEMVGQTRSCSSRPHAELHRIRFAANATPNCPFELGYPRLDRVPHGGGELPARASRHLGRAEGTDRLSREQRRREPVRVVGVLRTSSKP